MDLNEERSTITSIAGRMVNMKIKSRTMAIAENIPNNLMHVMGDAIFARKATLVVSVVTSMAEKDLENTHPSLVSNEQVDGKMT